jgi:hypothetical protein
MARRAAALVLLLIACCAAPAAAQPYVPAGGKVALGLAGRADTGAFEAATGRKPSVFQTFVMFDGPTDYAFERAARLHAAPMLHISTADGPAAREVVSPKGIATGAVDHWLIGVHRQAVDVGGPIYVRAMGEMNGHWNQYSAYGPHGKRNASHSTAWFKRAWRRMTIILRGGPDVAAQLQGQHLVPLRGSATAVAEPAPIAMVWCPQVEGAPDVAGNAPRAYWPGRRWVDWVSTDFYSKFPNWDGLERYYKQFGGKPFSFGEWALWDHDDAGWAKRLFGWVRSHKRVKMLVYNQGFIKGGPFDLGVYPNGTRAIRKATKSSRYDG